MPDDFPFWHLRLKGAAVLGAVPTGKSAFARKPCPPPYPATDSLKGVSQGRIGF